MRALAVVSTIGFLMLLLCAPCMAGETPTSPLVLTGSDILEIDGEDLICAGEIVLRDQARLVVKNSDFVMTRIDPRENWGIIQAFDESHVELVNVAVAGDSEGLWVAAYNDATIELEHIRDRFSAEAADNGYVSIRDCDPQELRIGDHGTIVAEDVSIGWVIDFNLGDDAPYELSGLQPDAQISEQVFGLDQGLPFHLELRNAMVRGWSVHVRRESDVRLVDSVFERIVIMQDYASGDLTGLRPRLYQQWIYPDDLDMASNTRLELVNTEMADHWAFRVYGNAQLNIADCADVFFTFESGYMDLAFSNCSIRSINFHEAMADVHFGVGVVIEENLDITDCVWMTLKGELSFGNDGRIERWENSMVQRTYPFQLRAMDGAPAVDREITVTLEDGTVQTIATDSEGRAFLTMIHDDSNYGGSMQAVVDPGDRPIERSISFVSNTPIVFDFLRASVDPTTLYVGTTNELRDFYPSHSPLVGHVYESLFVLDINSRPIPLLAEEVPSFANGGIVLHDDGSATIAVTPREGLLFHSGDAVLLSDIEYCLEEALLSFRNDLVPDALEAVGIATLELDIEELGAEAVAQIIQDAIHIEDDRILIELALPYSGIWAFLSQVAIVPRSWLVSHGFWDGSFSGLEAVVDTSPIEGFVANDGIGTGPYVIEMVSEDMRNVILVQNRRYWGSDLSIEEVRISFNRTPQELIDLMDAEKLDVLVQMPAERLADGRLIANALKELDTVKPIQAQDQSGIFWGLFNQTIASSDRLDSLPTGEFGASAAPVDFFSDLNVRLAFLHAFDWDGYIEDMWFEGRLFRQVGTLFSHQLFEAHREPVSYEYDPVLAAQYFSTAWDGALMEHGFTTYASFNGGNMMRRAFSNALTASIAAIDARFVVDLYDPDFNTVVNGLFDDAIPLAVLGLTEGIDVLTIPYHLLYSTGLYPEGATVPNYDNPLERATWTLDLDIRDAALDELRRMAIDDPIGFFWRRQLWAVSQEWVEGIAYNPYYKLTSIPDFRLQSVTKRAP